MLEKPEEFHRFRGWGQGNQFGHRKVLKAMKSIHGGKASQRMADDGIYVSRSLQHVFDDFAVERYGKEIPG